VATVLESPIDDSQAVPVYIVMLVVFNTMHLRALIDLLDSFYAIVGILVSCSKIASYNPSQLSPVICGL
jgi:hypothetical protein